MYLKVFKFGDLVIKKLYICKNLDILEKVSKNICWKWKKYFFIVELFIIDFEFSWFILIVLNKWNLVK